VPVGDMTRLGEPLDAEAAELVEGPAAVRPRRSIWPAVHARLLALVREHRSTIIFVNSRRLAERLAAALNELAGEDLARAHHGSVAREERLLIEDRLKAGKLPALVATSTLELGIDMGAVDLVVQIESPLSVASGMQRVGRAGHRAGVVSKGIFFPKHRADLLGTAAVTAAMLRGDVEPTRIPENPLDVLAQQIVSILVAGERDVNDLLTLVRRAAPFAQLPTSAFEGVLDMLAGRYPWERHAGLRPRIVWDRSGGRARAREGARAIVVANAGTIPDRGLYSVFLADGPAAGRGRPRAGGRRVGELDEEMVFESREGEVFVLGASSWRIVDIGRDRVLVQPAPGEPGKMPFWKADSTSRPVDLGAAVGRLTRELLRIGEGDAIARLRERHALDEQAARNCVSYLRDQAASGGAVPDDRTIVVERMRDEMGDLRLCVLSPWGRRVHAPWALAIEASLELEDGTPAVETMVTDDGIVIRMPDREQPPATPALIPDPDSVRDVVARRLAGSPHFAGRFREAASRALLLPRRRPGRRSPLWLQRRRAHDLLGEATRYPSFPMVLEAYRECLLDDFDLPSLVDLLRRIRRREIRIVTVDTEAPSPFAASLLFGYVGNYIYEGDAPAAERKAQALLVDPRHLRELLGEVELREMLDPAAIDELELSLQGLADGYHARHTDELHELLMRLGDLSLEELAARVEVRDEDAHGDRISQAREWLASLQQQQRVILVRLVGEERAIAVEDAARYRDGLGAALPPGLPASLLAPADDPVHRLVARYASSRGPFTAEEVAQRYGLGAAVVMGILTDLAARGTLIEGALRPGGQGRDWCDAEILRIIRQRSLARLRRQVAPVPPEALAACIVEWQGAGKSADEPAGAAAESLILDAVARLQGAPLLASTLETDVLPARVPDYRSSDLDLLCAAGEIVWLGREPLGEHDGRISLYLASDLPLLAPEPAPPPSGARQRALIDFLTAQGASFFPALKAAAGDGMEREIVDALWDLVWAGCVTCDTLAPLRAFVRPRAAFGRSRARRGRVASLQGVPPAVRGRWALVPGPPAAGRNAARAQTERAIARAQQLVERFGVLTRDAVVAEGWPGGFTALYPILTALAERGEVRRGYFTTGLGASQFAVPAAAERLRALAEADSPLHGVVLAATDPANPYGAVLPWPEAQARLARVAGSHVVLVGGRLGAFLARDGAEIVPLLPPDEPWRRRVAEAVAAAIAAWAHRTGRALLDWSASPGGGAEDLLGSCLLAAGFERAGRGWRLIRGPEKGSTRARG
jgi:ATP-dependent Lhr-like helicase